MSTISELKNQILTANALGIANLSDKGITLTENATTYDIMRGISNIQTSGNGGGSVGNLCTHTTSVVYRPVPRYKTNVTVTLPPITHETEVQKLG